MSRETSTLVLVVLLVAACTAGGSGGSDPWLPPSKDIVDTGSDSVITGRLWLVPNPLRIRPDWAGTTVHDSEPVRACVFNIGCEDVDIEHASTEGTTDGVFYGGFYTEHNFPIRMGGSPDCSGRSGWCFEMRYLPTGSGLGEAHVVLETDDPTSPTLRVPILLDETGRLTPESHHDHPVEYRESFVEVSPNPIRLDAGASGTLELIIFPEGELGTEILGVHVYGEGLGLSGSTEELMTVLTYSSASDGSLIVGFETSWGDELSLVVPILAR